MMIMMKMTAMMMISLMIIMMIIAVTQSIFKLGPPDLFILEDLNGTYR